ncbi:phosphatidylethanolamine N-methyltransferase [Dinochytrium kinnereticum]|nr:phosphatidylethanolamine N-methyltransferase [Dinochytrium kinnereticum]
MATKEPVEETVDGDEEEAAFSWGRTFKGQVFQVPQTQDAVQALFNPTTPQSVFEWSIMSVLAVEVAILMMGTRESNKMTFLYLFAFWRIVYNVGLGVFLKLQSTHAVLVRWAKKLNLGGRQQRKRGPWVEYFVGELKKKIGLVDESFEALPAEFTTWILFRGVVDLIMVNDNICYLFFAIAHFDIPSFDSLGWTDWLRYLAGTILVIFGWWVRLDAKREIKDFAWYWGDFFFLIDTSPTLSGVYEMAPHPMYSVGYVGFYGAALIAKSYTVLFVSLAAHVAQLMFLFFVENPHLEKVYKSPNADSDGRRFSSLGNGLGSGYCDHSIQDTRHDKKILQNYFQRDLIILRNFDWFRSSDLFTVGIWIYTLITAIMVGPIEESPWKLYFYVGQAVFWRFTYNWVLGLILHLQSTSKFWSRHFIKYGETTKEAFQQWKIIFNMSQSMTYITFFICACRFYTVPENWLYGTVMLKHTVALITICLHAWTAISIHNALGDFGWFYGDFFLDAGALRDQSRLNYTGVYRFLNHPNAWAATASAWGITWVCGNWYLIWLTVFGQASNWLFVRYVELPHMKKKYGTRVRPREEAGMPKALREGVERIEGRAKAVVGRVVRNLDRRMGGRIGSLRRVMSTSGIWDIASWKDDGEDDIDTESMSSSFEKEKVRYTGGTDRECEDRSRWGRRSQSVGQTVDDDDDDDDGALIIGKARNTRADSGNRQTEGWKGSAEEGSGEDGESAGVGGGFRRRREGLPFRLSRPTSFSETMKVAVSRTKPRVNQIVEDAKMIVTKRVERLASVTSRSPSPLIPLALYTLTFPAHDDSVITPTPQTPSSSHPIITFRLGEPINIRFTCARETLKRLDWVGIYGASHNLSPEITTSRNSLWIFVTGLWRREDDEDPSKPLLKRVQAAGRVVAPTILPLSSDEEGGGAVSDDSVTLVPPSVDAASKTDVSPTATTSRKRKTSNPAVPTLLSTRVMLGETPVTVNRSKNDPGLRVVTGTLKFHRTRLPWKLGAYEARYHLDGSYSVLAISQVFEVVVDPFDWDGREAAAGGLVEALESPLFGGPDPLRSIGGSFESRLEDGGEEEVVDTVVVRVIRVLREYVERCVDIDGEEPSPVGEEVGVIGRGPLGIDEDILEKCVPGEDTPDARSFSRYKERVAKRIVYGVRQIFGIDFSWKVVRILGTVRMLARKICEARVALSPVQVVTGDGDGDSIRSFEAGNMDDDYDE